MNKLFTTTMRLGFDRIIFFILLMPFLFSQNTASAQTWTQIGSDIDGEAAYDYSGYSVSLSI